MKRSLLGISCILFFNTITGQVAINTDASTAHGSAILDLKSTNRGFLPPRMTWPQIQAIQTPATGLLLFDEGLKAMRMYNGTSWVVLSPKAYGLNDPPGNFSTIAASSSSSNTRGNRIVVGHDKRVYVAGILEGTLVLGNDAYTSSGQQDIFFAVFDSSGNYLFSKKIDGTGSDHVNEIVVNETGIYITGYISGTTDFDPGAGLDNHSVVIISPYFARYDLAGNLVWARHLTATNASYASNVTIDPAGNLYFCGFITGGSIDADPGAGIFNVTTLGGWEGFFAKYNSNGDFIWAKKIGNTGNDLCDGLLLLNGTLVLAGLFAGTVDFDPSAATFNLISTGVSDYFLSRYDTSGNLLWAKAIGTPGAETTINHNLAADFSGNICFGSLFSGTIDVNPDVGIMNLTSAGGLDFFIAKYNSSGALLPFAIRIGGTMDDNLSDIKTDNQNNVYATGSFAGTVDFDPSGSIMNLVSFDFSDIFLAKFSSNATLAFAKNMGGSGIEIAGGVAAFTSGKLVFSTGGAQAPYMGLNSERVLITGFFLQRYEE